MPGKAFLHSGSGSTALVFSYEVSKGDSASLEVWGGRPLVVGKGDWVRRLATDPTTAADLSGAALGLNQSALLQVDGQTPTTLRLFVDGVRVLNWAEAPQGFGSLAPFMV